MTAGSVKSVDCNLELQDAVQEEHLDYTTAVRGGIYDLLFQLCMTYVTCDTQQCAALGAKASNLSDVVLSPIHNHDQSPGLVKLSFECGTSFREHYALFVTRTGTICA